MDGKRWLPLEANPDFGACVKAGSLGDVYGLDPELLSMVPNQCVLFLLLFPVTEKYESIQVEREGRIKKRGQDVSSDVYYHEANHWECLWYNRLIHAVANRPSQSGIRSRFLH
ncbi:unnamed protein product [Boreogadus saida]